MMGSVGNNGVCVEANCFLDIDVSESRLAGNGDKEPQNTHTIRYMSAPAIYWLSAWDIAVLQLAQCLSLIGLSLQYGCLTIAQNDRPIMITMVDPSLQADF